MNMTIIGMVVNTVLLAVAIYAVKTMLGNLSKHIQRCVDKLDQEDKDIWQALNTHGHKGLDQNGSRVTR